MRNYLKKKKTNHLFDIIQEFLEEKFGTYRYRYVIVPVITSTDSYQGPIHGCKPVRFAGILYFAHLYCIEQPSFFGSM